MLSAEALGRTTTKQANKADPKEANLQVLPARGRVLEPSCQRCAMGKASPASPREVELAVVRFFWGRERPGGGYLL